MCVCVCVCVCVCRRVCACVCVCVLQIQVTAWKRYGESKTSTVLLLQCLHWKNDKQHQ